MLLKLKDIIKKNLAINTRINSEILRIIKLEDNKTITDTCDPVETNDLKEKTNEFPENRGLEYIKEDQMFQKEKGIILIYVQNSIKQIIKKIYQVE